MDFDFTIPVMPPRMAPPKHDYPISPKENMLRVCRHEKPMYMPTNTFGIQWPMIRTFNDLPMDVLEDMTDWFGIQYKYEEVQQSPTSVSTLWDEIGDWKEKLIYPDLDKVDFTPDLKKFNRDPGMMTGARLGVGIFERLHFCEGFENALCDIMEEPEECHDFFSSLSDYKIDVFKRLNDLFHFDIVCHNDDWSNARAPFFSVDTFENTLREPSVRLAEAVHKEGVYYMVHCCGMMEVWLPYIVNEIKAEVLEIQTINDFRMILDKYSDRTAPIYAPDPYIMYNPRLKPEEARQYARDIVDQYGAQTCDGPGVITKLIGRDPEVYYAFEEELFHYSLEKYAKFN